MVMNVDGSDDDDDDDDDDDNCRYFHISFVFLCVNSIKGKFFKYLGINLFLNAKPRSKFTQKKCGYDLSFITHEGE